MEGSTTDTAQPWDRGAAHSPLLGSLLAVCPGAVSLTRSHATLTSSCTDARQQGGRTRQRRSHPPSRSASAWVSSERQARPGHLTASSLIRSVAKMRETEARLRRAQGSWGSVSHSMSSCPDWHGRKESPVEGLGTQGCSDHTLLPSQWSCGQGSQCLHLWRPQAKQGHSHHPDATEPEDVGQSSWGRAAAV